MFFNHRRRRNSNISLNLAMDLKNILTMESTSIFPAVPMCANLNDLHTTLQMRRLGTFLLGTCLTIRTFNNQIDNFTCVVCNERCYTEHVKWSHVSSRIHSQTLSNYSTFFHFQHFFLSPLLQLFHLQIWTSIQMLREYVTLSCHMLISPNLEIVP